MALSQCHASFNQFLDQDLREFSGGNQYLMSDALKILQTQYKAVYCVCKIFHASDVSTKNLTSVKMLVSKIHYCKVYNFRYCIIKCMRTYQKQ